MTPHAANRHPRHGKAHPQHHRALRLDKGYRGHNAPPDHKFRSSSRVRGEVSRRRSSAPCAADPPSSLSSAISRPSNYLWFKHGRCQQRRACRRRLQLPPSPPLAQAFAAPNPGRTLRPAAAQYDLKTGIFMIDNCVAGTKTEDRKAGDELWPNSTTSGECAYVHQRQPILDGQGEGHRTCGRNDRDRSELVASSVANHCLLCDRMRVLVSYKLRWRLLTAVCRQIFNVNSG